MSNNESWRDAGTCLGGFLGMFFGAMLGFAICLKYIVETVTQNDRIIQPNQALLTFLGVLACGCIGAVAGALLVRLIFAIYTRVFYSSEKSK